jgi:leucyl aminopeptidase
VKVTAYSPQSFIYIKVRAESRSAWQGKLLFEFSPAAETPGPTVPGKEVGEIGPSRIVTDQHGETQLISVSMGPKEKINQETLRRVGGSISRWIHNKNISQAGIDLAGLDELHLENGLVSLAEGLYLGAYRFDRYKSDREEQPVPEISLLTNGDASGLNQDLDKVEILTKSVNLAREWDHLPANVINPISLADYASQVASASGLKITVIDDTQLREMGAGAILAVGQGSQTPSRLIILEYPGQSPSSEAQPVILVGKAITFDTGGYSIKSTEGILGMKYDKSGGLVVLATLQAAAALKLDLPIVGIIAAAENMISGKSYRPDDILTSLSGKTIEIISTDAEGRLVLSDALTYAQQHFKPQAIVDLATLTGGVVVALGHVRAGIMSNNQALSQQLQAAGERTFERLWPLPLDDDYFKNIEGEEADIKNSGGREGAPIFGGIFLKQFVDDSIPWAHLDIAGTADTTKALPYCPKGATGFGVRLLIDFLTNRGKA